MQKILGYIISIMPTNTIRVFLYRFLFGHSIYKSYIGWGTVIIVKSAVIINSKIDRNNKFLGPMKVVIRQGAFINKNNVFKCGEWTKSKNKKNMNYQGRLEIGEGTHISRNHYFDIAGSLIIGNNSWIAGSYSQFWTHGAGVIDRNIVIGNDCYIGSAVRFSPGSSIGNNSIISLGSVITKKFNNENVLIAGQPAKIIRENYDWKERNKETNKKSSASHT